MVTKAQLAEKILVKLGKGAIRPNLTAIQVDQAIDEAVDYFTDYAEYATEEKFYKHKVTQEDIDRGDNTIILPADILTVNKMLPVRKRAVFSYEDGTYANLTPNAYSYLSMPQNGLHDLYVAKQYIEMFKSMFSASDGFSYSKFSNRIQLDLEIDRDVKIDDYLVFHVKTLLGTSSLDRLYSDRLLFKLATAYARQYEAVNLTKLQNIGIPNAVKVNVDQLESRAEKEIQKIEREVNDYYRPSLGIYIY